MTDAHSATGARAFPRQAPQADQLPGSFDKRCAAVIRRLHRREWRSRSLYQMLLNSCMGAEAMITAVENAACLASLCAGIRRRLRSADSWSEPGFLLKATTECGSYKRCRPR